MTSARNNKKKRSSNNTTNKQKSKDPSILGALQGKNLEIIVAALLLTGKLRVESVTLLREANVFVQLAGQYKTLSKESLSDLTSFLDEEKVTILENIIEMYHQG